VRERPRRSCKEDFETSTGIIRKDKGKKLKKNRNLNTSLMYTTFQVLSLLISMPECFLY